jgi:2-polyprenyl-3-methyl-5-hydroxy-6-metoxy-1,4-benzoquinol methylase
MTKKTSKTGLIETQDFVGGEAIPPREYRFGTDAWQVYGAMAAMDLDPIIQGGRYRFQQEAERRIIADILPKLKLDATQRLLEIGCGAGALLVPLSFHVAEAVGIDHPDVISWLERRYTLDHVTYVAGQFPDVATEGKFDRILCYGVMQAMRDFSHMKAFILTASDLLAPGGRFLIGDVANRDRQQRFRATEAGRKFEERWKNLKASQQDNKPADVLAAEKMSLARQVGGITDEQLFDLLLALREMGFDSYVVEQGPDLPHGLTREDIIVTRRHENAEA